MAAGSTDLLIQDSTAQSFAVLWSPSVSLPLPSLRFSPCAAAPVPMSDLVIRSLHFTPRGYKMGKTLLVLFKMYLKSLVAFQIWHSTSAAQSLFLHETCCICAASVHSVCPSWTEVSADTAHHKCSRSFKGLQGLCAAITAREPPIHPELLQREDFLFNNKLKSPKEVF